MKSPSRSLRCIFWPCCCPDPRPLQDKHFIIHPTDILRPLYDIVDGKPDLKLTGKQLMKGYRLQCSAGGNPDEVDWMGLCECYDTKDKKWLITRIYAYPYAQRKK